MSAGSASVDAGTTDGAPADSSVPDGSPSETQLVDDAATDVAPADATPSDGQSSDAAGIGDGSPPDTTPFSRRISALAATPVPELVSVKSADPYGLSVRPSLDHLGVNIENTKRIHRHYFVFRSGYVPSTGQSTDPPTPLATWVPIADGDLKAVTGLTGVVTCLIDFWDGKLAWNPTVTPTIPLPLDPSNAKANAFKVYVVGGGGIGPVNPDGSLALPADLTSLQPNLVSSITAAARSATLLELFKELIWPLITKIVPTGASLNISDNAWVDYAGQFAKELGSLQFNLDANIINGDLKKRSRGDN